MNSRRRSKLTFLHPDSTLNRLKLDALRRLSTDGLCWMDTTELQFFRSVARTSISFLETARKSKNDVAVEILSNAAQ